MSVRAPQDLGYLVHGVDEDEAADPGELGAQRVGQVQGELGEGRHRTGDVGQDHQFRLRGLGGRKTGVIGTPPVDIDSRTVRRKSSAPRRRCRCRCASFAASLRAIGATISRSCA